MLKKIIILIVIMVGTIAGAVIGIAGLKSFFNNESQATMLLVAVIIFVGFLFSGSSKKEKPKKERVKREKLPRVKKDWKGLFSKKLKSNMEEA